MNVQGLRSDAEQRLDELLECWAEHCQLNQVQVEEIRQAILATSDELGFEWWDQFHEYIRNVLDRAHGLAGSGTTSLQIANYDVLQALGGSGFQLQEPEGYQPYLRLA
jgi:hypothetical protein